MPVDLRLSPSAIGPVDLGVRFNLTNQFGVLFLQVLVMRAVSCLAMGVS